MSADLQLGLFGRARVRLVRQTEVAECGLASLAMIANYHGLDVDLAPCGAASSRRCAAPR